MPPKKILNAKQISTIIQRLSFQLIEDHGDFSKTSIIGIQPRGTTLTKRIVSFLKSKSFSVEMGVLDITFFRDDFRRNKKVLKANQTKLDFSIENKTVVLVDDVLFTGRSIRAALTSLENYGRPLDIQLLVLIDRRFSRHLPIQPDFIGAQVDALEGDKVRVQWKDEKQNDAVFIEKK